MKSETGELKATQIQIIEDFLKQVSFIFFVNIFQFLPWSSRLYISVINNHCWMVERAWNVKNRGLRFSS